MEEITVYDNLITQEENEKYRTTLLCNSHFRYGERDLPYLEPTGVVCDFTNTMNSDDMVDPYLNSMLKNLLNKIYEKNDFLKKMRLYRVYLNLFIPNEQPSFHTDGDNTITCLYYLNPLLDLNEGGETQFFIDEEIRGIVSKPGRLTMFNGRLLHRATSFKSHPRLTLAFKFI
jgi:hypothetical protein|tara:strand:- start:110 stop:628 length:519 start_codon:yes stop_codon:yes gene_type:complete